MNKIVFEHVFSKTEASQKIVVTKAEISNYKLYLTFYANQKKVIYPLQQLLLLKFCVTSFSCFCFSEKTPKKAEETDIFFKCIISLKCESSFFHSYDTRYPWNVRSLFLQIYFKKERGKPPYIFGESLCIFIFGKKTLKLFFSFFRHLIFSSCTVIYFKISWSSFWQKNYYFHFFCLHFW